MLHIKCLYKLSIVSTPLEHIQHSLGKLFLIFIFQIVSQEEMLPKWLLDNDSLWQGRPTVIENYREKIKYDLQYEKIEPISIRPNKKIPVFRVNLLVKPRFFFQVFWKKYNFMHFERRNAFKNA